VCSAVSEEERKEELACVFSRYDVEGKGYLTSDEISELAITHRKGDWDEKRNRNLVAAMCSSRDGQVKCDELIEYFMETWHGGMGLMEDKEFTRAVDELVVVREDHGAMVRAREEARERLVKLRESAAREGTRREVWQREELELIFTTYDVEQRGSLYAVDVMELASTHHQMTDTDETVWGEEQNEHLVAVMDRDSDGSVDKEVCCDVGLMWVMCWVVNVVDGLL